MDLKELIAEAKRIGDLTQGCSNGYCKFGGVRSGMHTNGGCRCTADPSGRSDGPYGDFQYMANLLKLIALEFEKEDK